MLELEALIDEKVLTDKFEIKILIYKQIFEKMLKLFLEQ
jgi:hypothetical protein